MSIELASRITNSGPKSYGMYEKALQYERNGANLIHLEFGCPIYDTPEHIKRATISALNQGLVHYSDMQGELVLRQALTDKLSDFNNIDVGAHQVLVTNGLTQASYATFMALLDEGDEVILLEPYYPQHVGKIELAGAKVVRVPLDKENNYSICADSIKTALTSKTKMIVLVNPTNPTGRVYTIEELKVVADIAIDNDLVVVSDEVYE